MPIPFFIGKPASLFVSGPLVAVKLCVPEAVKSKVPPINTLAEIDTGAPITLIQEGVATSLGLVPEKTVKITATTRYAYESYVFPIRLVFPEGNWFELSAIEVPFILRKPARVKCIIGRDLLSRCILTYNGFSNMFTLKF
jgi:hypothetical protein